jgi:hypothetical protein
LCNRFEQLEHFETHGALNAERYRRTAFVLEQLARVARVIRGARRNLFAP